MKTYRAVYKDGTIGKVKHRQVDTGLGFTCDAGVKKVVVALNKAGWETNGSCESEGMTWLVPRKVIGFRHRDTHKLLDFCLKLKALIPKTGFQVRMILDNYFIGEPIFVSIEYLPELEHFIFKALR